MSGVYLKGMEMPKRGHTVTLTILGGGEVCVQYYDCKPHLTVPIVYKAVPVPDHGRLGDLDDVINDVRHYLCEGCSDYFGPDAKTESCDYCRGTMLIKAIERKSSIIPAEEGQ